MENSLFQKMIMKSLLNNMQTTPDRNMKKYNIGELVSVKGVGMYRIKGSEQHGKDICGCCDSDPYYLYNIGGNWWVNEDQLVTKIN